MHEVPIPSGSGKPAPEPELEKPKEAKGFIDNAPLAPPPGIQWIDAMCNADAAREKISRAIDAKSQMVERIIDELIKKTR
jgi:hypothetical protein